MLVGVIFPISVLYGISCRQLEKWNTFVAERIPSIRREASYFAVDLIKVNMKMKSMKMFGCITLLTGLAVCAGCGNTPKNESQTPEPVKVKTMKMEPALQAESRRFSGTVEEENGSVLSFSVMGTLKHIYVNLGSRVKKGQLVAEVDRTSMESSYRAAKASMEQAEDAYQRMKELHDKGSLAEIKWIEVQSQYRQACSMEEIARKNLDDCKLYAPFSGVIAEKSAEIGQNVAPGVPVVKLVTDGQLRISIPVPEAEIAHVELGQQASVCVSALKEGVFTGRVAEKGIQAHPLSRSYLVKIKPDKAVAGLMPGMVAEVSLAAGDKGQVYVIPASILQTDENNRTFVWLQAGGKAVRRVVECGEFTPQGVTVLSGLKAGDEIIVEGQQKVCEGTPVTL